MIVPKQIGGADQPKLRKNHGPVPATDTKNPVNPTNWCDKYVGRYGPHFLNIREDWPCIKNLMRDDSVKEFQRVYDQWQDDNNT